MFSLFTSAPTAARRSPQGHCRQAPALHYRLCKPKVYTLCRPMSLLTQCAGCAYTLHIPCANTQTVRTVFISAEGVACVFYKVCKMSSCVHNAPCMRIAACDITVNVCHTLLLRSSLVRCLASNIHQSSCRIPDLSFSSL